MLGHASGTKATEDDATPVAPGTSLDVSPRGDSVPPGRPAMAPTNVDLSTLHPAGTGYLDESSKKALTNRLARLEGHVRAVSQMLEEERCVD